MASSTSSVSYSDLQTLAVSRPAPGVLHVEINRPKRLNSMTRLFWEEMRTCFRRVRFDAETRAVLFSGRGRLFTAGLDLMDHSGFFAGDDVAKDDVSRRAVKLRRFVLDYQESFSVMEACPQPVIVCVHGGCVGGGIDLMCAADVRMCSEDAWFTIKEVDIGMAADVGTLQRLPKIVGNVSLMNELAFTARRFSSAEAKELGLVSQVCPTREDLIQKGLALAVTIASKSPVAIFGTKRNLLYARDHSVADGLEYMAAWNAAMVQSEDMHTAIEAYFAKKKPVYSRL